MRTTRRFVVETVFVIEDTEEDGFDDQKVEAILEDMLHVFHDAVKGSVDRDFKMSTGGKTLRRLSPKVSFEGTDIRLRVERPK